MKLNLKERKGITLIALVITIIVLLILAGVSIAMLTGQNGILTQAQNAKTTTDNKSAEEKVKLAVMAAISQSKDGTLDADKLVAEIVNNYGGTATKTGTGFPVNATVDGKSFTIDGDGNVTSKEDSNQPTPNPTDKISKNTSYVGYYADIDADGKVDGVIYADLAKGDNVEKKWNNDSDSKYTIPTVTEGLKDYYISQTNYKANEGFGTKDVISPTGTGKDRFYIMALKDITKNGPLYDWYNAAYGKMRDYATTTSGDFGKGKSNTTTMISKWNLEKYGDKDKDSSHKDMWGQIQEEVNNGWFVPSRAEWSAFGGELGITLSNYGKFGLNDDYYWSSSQYGDDNAWYARLLQRLYARHQRMCRLLCPPECDFLIL